MMIASAEQAAASADSAYDALQARFDSGLKGLKQQLEDAQKQQALAVTQKQSAETRALEAAEEAAASEARAATAEAAEREFKEHCTRHAHIELRSIY